MDEITKKCNFQVCRKSDEVLCTICGQELTCKCLLNVCPDHTDSDDDDDDDDYDDDDDDDDGDDDDGDDDLYLR